MMHHLFGVLNYHSVRKNLKTKDKIVFCFRVRIGKTGLLLLMYLLSWVMGLLVIAREDFSSQYFFSMFLVILVSMK